MAVSIKPIGRKNYGSIPHLPNSRMGPGDHSCHEGQLIIATKKARDRHDLIIVTEKLDGSNVGIARVGNAIHAIGRAGYLAQSSPYEQHQLFAHWVRGLEVQFRNALNDGERIVGEWMAQAHGARYSLPNGPFIAFDIMVGDKRLPYNEVRQRCIDCGIAIPKLLHMGGPISVEDAMKRHGTGDHGLLDDPEGAVWRVERRGEFDFMAKWVRPDKVDGSLLPDIAGNEGKDIVWNWRPKKPSTQSQTEEPALAGDDELAQTEDLA